MSDQETLVYVDVKGHPTLVGRLWSRYRHSRESATFEYDRAWLTHPERFALEPALSLGRGAHHTSIDQRLFGALGDSAPDRWGRNLMLRSERRRASQEGRAPQSLGEIDFLLLVDDEARQGALRFAFQEGGPYLAAGKASRIPPFIELPRLLQASERVVTESDTEDDLRLLLAPGSSLGGARPKAVIRDRNRNLAVAKFPHRNDEIEVEKWEALALVLAERAGIVVPRWRTESILDKTVLLLERFDRQQDLRIPFLSAMSMIGARDHESHSYLEIVDAIRRYGAQPDADCRELWRRMVFNVLVTNTDDHLRNHGFLYVSGRGWKLSPAYDMNPIPIDMKPRNMTTSITPDDDRASLELALEFAEYFGLDQTKAQRIAAEVGAAVTGWRGEAIRHQLTSSAIDRMASAFEHRDLDLALAFRQG